jgi:ABC-type glycerol-3-phosphate transport system substrate-binding protein
MRLKNKLGLAAGGALLLTLAACGGDGSPFNLGSAAGDGNINAAEATTLTRSTTETGEPDDVSNLMLATFETAEPFDLPD